jgi:hypothetical protein
MSIGSTGFGHDPAAMTPLFHSPKETEALLRISHAKLYRVIKQGRLGARKLDNKTLITRDSIERLAEELPSTRASAA